MLYFLIAVLAVALDQIVKRYAVLTLSSGGTAGLIPGLVHLRYLENDGAAFSSMSGMRWVLVGISAACAVVLIIVLLRTKLGAGGKLLLGFVLGGAVGNLIDRALHGYVVDMFEFEFIQFPVFNVADIFITVCGILFVLYYIVVSAKASRRRKAAQEQKRAAVAETMEQTDGQTPTLEQILSDYELEHMFDEE